ncbi:DUF6411 family protein [Spirillospora sp. NPDC047279]|uniref:DUF6411 family protein n=1 Tax=Spirillospora sp. NPDC047279 TaxID=3155478 RepID=UPI003402ABE6
MVVAAIIGVCVLLLLLGFLVPRLSHGPQRGTNRALGTGGRTAGKAPGALGRWLAKPFHKSNRMANRSAHEGRRNRGKMPF